MIESIRKKFQKESKTNAEYYHELDITRVRTDDWLIERFIKEYGTEDKAYEELVKTLKWKRVYGLHDRTDQYYPKEFYDLNAIEIHGRDRGGRLLHWETTKNLIKINDFIPLEQQFMAHRLEKLDTEAGRDGWTLITDTLGSGLPNVSLEMWKFRIELLKNYPQGLRQVLIVDLPCILNPIMKIIVSFLSPKVRENVFFIKRQQLSEFIDVEQIPVRMTGLREKMHFPDGLKSMTELSHLGLKEKQLDIYRTKHQMIVKRTRIV